MKLRSLVVFGAGVTVGMALSRRMTQDDPTILHGPSAQSTSNPALRAVGTGAQRLADRAGIVSLEVIRRARGRIQERLGEDELGDAQWS